MTTPRLGFFTRLLDDAPAAERYRLATEQIVHAEAEGVDVAAVAQHHFDGDEGGLPAPLVFLSHLAAHTRRIRLGTGIITLPLDQEIRVAEDASVLDLLSGHRLELGLGSGGSPSAFAAFGRDHADRHAIMTRQVDTLTAALRGEPLDDVGNRLYPHAPGLVDRVWIATFSEPWAREAGRRGFGLQLSRTQPRPPDDPGASLADIQNPVIDAYLEELPTGPTPRISVARTLFVADDHQRARALAENGYRRSRFARKMLGDRVRSLPADDLLAHFDVHAGDAEAVLESLTRDTALARATHLSFQVHSIDPPHPEILRSIELTARSVAPELGWVRGDGAEPVRTEPLRDLERRSETV